MWRAMWRAMGGLWAGYGRAMCGLCGHLGQGPARPATSEAPWQRTARTLRAAGLPAGRWAVLKSFKGRTLIPVRAKKRADAIGWPPDAPGPPDVILSWANVTQAPDRRAKNSRFCARTNRPMQAIHAILHVGCEGEAAALWHVSSFFARIGPPTHSIPSTFGIHRAGQVAWWVRGEWGVGCG